MSALACALPILFMLAQPAQARLEYGLRLESLTFDEGLEFSCDQCDGSDPDCNMGRYWCQAAQLDGVYEGVMFGALLGAGAERPLGAMFRGYVGVRLVAAFGNFSAEESPDDYPDALLTHVTVELPLEINSAFGIGEGFLQVTPRLGLLQYSSDVRFEEDPDTFTAGILLTLGLRLGGPNMRVGVQAGLIEHPEFSGRVIQATVIDRGPSRSAGAEPQTTSRGPWSARP